MSNKIISKSINCIEDVSNTELKKQDSDHKASTKSAVLSLLRKNTNVFLSGEKIAEQLCLSRASVWKAIKFLKKSGYEISSQKTGQKGGYKLSKDIEDALFPWEFGVYEQYITYFDKIDSTMNEARRIALSKTSTEHPFYLIIANRQTEENNTNHKNEHSPENGLCFTLLIKDKISSSKVHCLTVIAQLALVATLNKIISTKSTYNRRYMLKNLNPFRVRWPNEIWSFLLERNPRAGKIAGILNEHISSGNVIEWCSIGVDINIQEEPAEVENSLSIETVFKHYKEDFQISKKKLINGFLTEFFEYYKKLDKPKQLTDQWNLFCTDIGHRIRTNEEQASESFLGIDEYGWALMSNNKHIPPSEKHFKNSTFHNLMDVEFLKLYNSYKEFFVHN